MAGDAVGRGMGRGMGPRIREDNGGDCCGNEIFRVPLRCAQGEMRVGLLRWECHLGREERAGLKPAPTGGMLSGMGFWIPASAGMTVIRGSTSARTTGGGLAVAGDAVGGMGRDGVFRRRDSSTPLRFAQNDMWVRGREGDGFPPSRGQEGGVALGMAIGWRRAVREPPL